MKKELNMELYKEFIGVEMIEEWGNRVYESWAKYYKTQKLLLNKSAGCEIDELIIEGYCGNDFRYINNYLRFGKDSNSYEAELLAKQLMIVLSLAPRVPENIVVYRSVGEHTAKALLKDGIAVEKGFISTTMLMAVAENFEYYSKLPYLLKVYVEKETIGIYTPCIANGGEFEMLLSCDGGFKLLKESYKVDRSLVFECQLIY